MRFDQRVVKLTPGEQASVENVRHPMYAPVVLTIGMALRLGSYSAATTESMPIPFVR